MAYDCTNLCAEKLKPVMAGCKLAPRKGGANRLIFATCDLNIELLAATNSVASGDYWLEKVADCFIKMSPVVKASIASPSYSRVLTDGCKPESVINRTNTLNFMAYEDFSDFSDYDFWEHIDLSQETLMFGWVDCEKNFWGFFDRISVELGNVREDSVNTGTSHWEGKIEWFGRTQGKPINLDVMIPATGGAYNLWQYLIGSQSITCN